MQSGDLAALDSFVRQFDGAAFRKGLEISFTTTPGGKLVTKFDGKEVRGQGVWMGALVGGAGCWQHTAARWGACCWMLGVKMVCCLAARCAAGGHHCQPPAGAQPAADLPGARPSQQGCQGVLWGWAGGHGAAVSDVMCACLLGRHRPLQRSYLTAQPLIAADHGRPGPLPIHLLPAPRAHLLPFGSNTCHLIPSAVNLDLSEPFFAQLHFLPLSALPQTSLLCHLSVRKPHIV